MRYPKHIDCSAVTEENVSAELRCFQNLFERSVFFSKGKSCDGGSLVLVYTSTSGYMYAGRSFPISTADIYAFGILSRLAMPCGYSVGFQSRSGYDESLIDCRRLDHPPYRLQPRYRQWRPSLWRSQGLRQRWPARVFCDTQPLGSEHPERAG
jgi:hypothetical protein